ncbi:MAG: cytochrome P450 [Novosphingobium sp.]|nr:cytochrome P450 [Novosphingobium sp.]
MQHYPVLEDFDDPSFDPFMSDEAIFGSMVDPWTPLAELRRKGSVHERLYHPFLGMPPDASRPEMPPILVLGFEEAYEVLNTPAIFHQGYMHNLGVTFGHTLSVMNAPEHTRYRRILQRAFLPQVVAKWGETLVEPVIDELLGKFEKRGEADLVDEFTQHYPFGIIYRQLGLPPEQATLFHKMAISQTVYWAFPDKAKEASRKLGVFFAELVEQRKREPGGPDDLIAIMLNADVEGEGMPDDVIISFLRQLVNAAGDTTFRMTSCLLAALLENPDQYAAVRDDRSLILHAIEEGLRWEGPVLVQDRIAVTETELAGVKIPAGAYVEVVAGAANRDESKFPDPDLFDVYRSNKTSHLGFSRGPHICVGQHLARVEMTRALNAIFDRLPNLRLDPDKPRPVIRGVSLRRPDHIHVKFDPVT